jgi:hypothetical protein
MSAYTLLIIALVLLWYLIGLLIFWLTWKRNFKKVGRDWWIGFLTAVGGPLLLLGVMVIYWRITGRILGNLILAPVLLVFKLYQFIVFGVMVANLWFEMHTWLFWLILAYMTMQAYFIYSIRVRNKNYKFAAVQLHLQNTWLREYDDKRKKEITPKDEE